MIYFVFFCYLSHHTTSVPDFGQNKIHTNISLFYLVSCTQKNDVDASNQDTIDGNSIIKRHRKRRRGRKKHAATNCGTKEPKRPTEAQIEWQPQGKVCCFTHKTIEEKKIIIIQCECERIYAITHCVLRTPIDRNQITIRI